MKRVLFLVLTLLVAGAESSAAPKQSEDYSKSILGRWLGPRKFHIFHANGTWGVQRNEDAPEEINGRRWRIQGNELFLTFRGDAGLQTADYTIISFTPKRFVTDADGHKETYDRAP